MRADAIISIFQFTTSHGGRRCLQGCPEDVIIFQFTTSHGGRPVQYYMMSQESLFQFTTSHGGRHPTYQHHPCRRPFNSRPHTEVDLTSTDPEDISDIFQFTTSHGGRLGLPFYRVQNGSLSIHDLTRRSTITIWKSRKRERAFQFTTSHGGRLYPAAS